MCNAILLGIKYLEETKTKFYNNYDILLMQSQILLYKLLWFHERTSLN